MEHVLVGTSFSELGRSAPIVWSKSLLIRVPSVGDTYPNIVMRSTRCLPRRSGPRVVAQVNPQHKLGSVSLPCVADMWLATEGEEKMFGGCTVFQADVYLMRHDLRDLSPQECYEKVSKWAKREGMRDLMWEVLPPSTAMADEKIKLKLGPCNQQREGPHPHDHVSIMRETST